MRSTAMPIYHFNIHNDLEVLDIEGVECADRDIARARAIEGARSLICESVMKAGRIDLDHSIEVTDDGGQVVFVIPFADVVKIIGATGRSPRRHAAPGPVAG